MIEETLKAIAYDPKSVKIYDLNEGKYSEEPAEYGQDTGWVMRCDFSWTGMHNVPERQRWWFAISGISSVRIVHDQDWAQDFYYNIRK
jgi:hypothetical protein